MTARGPRVVLATTNEHKVAEITAILREVLPTLASGDIVGAGGWSIPNIVEDGVSFEENALIKARAVARHTGLAALADDSGICVEVMGGAPGIFSARWAGRHGDDAANLTLLLDQLEDVPDRGRKATFECVAALVDSTGREVTARGVMRGTLLRQPQGTGGFGYDPIFLAEGQQRANAELSPREKNAISHRRRAFEAIAPHLSDLLGHS